MRLMGDTKDVARPLMPQRKKEMVVPDGTLLNAKGMVAVSA